MQSYTDWGCICAAIHNLLCVAHPDECRPLMPVRGDNYQCVEAIAAIAPLSLRCAKCVRLARRLAVHSAAVAFATPNPAKAPVIRCASGLWIREQLVPSRQDLGTN